MKWVEKNRKALVGFKRSKVHDIDRLVEKFEEKDQKLLLNGGSS